MMKIRITYLRDKDLDQKTFESKDNSLYVETDKENHLLFIYQRSQDLNYMLSVTPLALLVDVDIEYDNLK